MLKDINELIKAIEDKKLLVKKNGEMNFSVSSISFDSRNVKKGTLFICKGAHFQLEYLKAAIEKGAVAYVSEEDFDIGKKIPSIIVKDIRKVMPIMAKSFYGDLSNKIKMIGITGTKGKSTIAYYLKFILDEFMQSLNKPKIAMCSGIRNYDGVIDEESSLTTPENLQIFEHMQNAINSDIEYMVMEVSSQALKYNRVDEIKYAISCFNNIGEDHISPSEHNDFNDYFYSKLKIFAKSEKCCINLDSEHFDEIIKYANNNEEVLTYSTKNEKANVYASDIVSNNGRVKFKLNIKNIANIEDSVQDIELASVGIINVINAIAAASVCLLLNVPIRYIKYGLNKATVPGRMQVFRSKSNRIAIVDYAHNKMSFDALLSSIKKEFPGKDIYIAFGSTGDKAQNRRREMGEVASKYCKHIILTEDDPGSEKVKDICDEIVTYINPKCTYEIIEDRPSAIRKLISYSKEDKIIIATGKANESTQKREGNIVKIESDIEILNKEFLNI